jgi:hypothetical protein
LPLGASVGKHIFKDKFLFLAVVKLFPYRMTFMVRFCLQQAEHQIIIDRLLFPTGDLCSQLTLEQQKCSLGMLTACERSEAQLSALQRRQRVVDQKTKRYIYTKE